MNALWLKKLHRNFHTFINNIWYKKNSIIFVLWPVGVIFKLISISRRKYLEKFCQRSFSVPIIVVGNISVGGVGKTPLVIAIAEHFTKQGLKVGIVSRGYKAAIKNFPYLVKKSDNAALTGDEPLLLALRTNCPVVIGPDRSVAVDYLLENCDLDLVISDDGLQHYRLARTVEIVVIDGVRGLGNGMCLPVGPLRESKQRLKEVDFVIINGATTNNFQGKNLYKMTLQTQGLKSCISGLDYSVNFLPKPIAAFAALGNPDRFFKTLSDLGLVTVNYYYPDHYFYNKSDFKVEEKSIVMTEKDFVKCKDFADERMFFLPVRALINNEFWENLESVVQSRLKLAG